MSSLCVHEKKSLFPLNSNKSSSVINHKLIQQRRQHVLSAYCPNMYTVPREFVVWSVGNSTILGQVGTCTFAPRWSL